jgi:small redox-active disulfide protein 2
VKKIQVLGPGCPRCTQLANRVKQAVDKLGIECEVEKVSDIVAITSMGVMLTPALVIDDEVVFQGKLPDIEELMQIIG